MKLFLPLLLIFCFNSCFCCNNTHNDVVVGAERFDMYLNKCTSKSVAIVANHTSLIGENHIVDVLIENDVNIKCIFCPEHGFRGDAGAGIHIDNSVDAKTGIPVVSLYGNHRKPTDADLKDIDVVLFDLQDVGVRFYTYISTMTYVMEACAANNIPVIVLDRPNPNAHYVDGPVLKDGFESFVGLHHVPIVYGMTIGEYALMVNGEKWLNENTNLPHTCELNVIPLDNYCHSTKYVLPVSPSPNLQTMNAIYNYPSLCLFEGTVASVGRGTEHPFEMVGHPKLNAGDTSFVPKVIPHVAENPKCLDEKCNGYSFTRHDNKLYSNLNVEILIRMFNELDLDNDFFIPYFEKLIGNDLTRKQILSGMSADEIKASWQSEISDFMRIRAKYLIYKES